MDRVLINPAIVSGIADAVREKKGSTGQIKVSELPDQIRSIEVGGVGENVKEVVEAISGVTSEEDVVIANGIAKGATDTPTEHTWNGERQTAGGSTIKDGVAYVDKVMGNTIKVVQLAKLETPITRNGVSVRQDGNKIILNGTANASAWVGFLFRIENFISDHEYVVRYWSQDGTKAYASIDQNRDLTNCIWKGSDGGNFVVTAIKDSVFDDFVLEAELIDLTTMFGIGNEPNTLQSYAETLGYASIDELPYIPYTEGEVVPMKAEAIVSRGRNLWDEEWEVGSINSFGSLTKSSNCWRCKNIIPVIAGKQYFITAPFIVCVALYDEHDTCVSFQNKSGGYSSVLDVPSNVKYIRIRKQAENDATYRNDVCVSLNNPSFNGQYVPYMNPDTLPLPISSILHEGQPLFPDGLNGIGDVKDEVDFARGKAVKRIGVVDMGTLDWGLYNGVFYANVNTKIFRPSALSGVIMSVLICSLYQTTYMTGAMSCNDKNMYEYLNNSNGRRIVIKDTSYSTHAEFKTAVSGVLLYYKLETPIEVTFEPCKAFYKAQNGGREEIVSDVFTAPVTAEIGYRGMSAEALMSSLSNIQNQ